MRNGGDKIARRALALALAIHAVLLGVLGAGRSRVEAPSTLAEASVELVELPAPEREEAVATMGAPPLGAAVRSSIARSGEARGPSEIAEPGATGGPTAASRPMPDDGWTFNPTQRPLITLGGPNPQLSRLPLEDPNEEAKLAALESIRRPLRERDLALGLGSEGPVVHALKDSTGRGVADVNGIAIFEAVIDGSGALLALSVLEANGPVGAWRDIAAAAKEAVAGDRGRAPGGRGVIARIKVESRWQLPSGHDPGANVTLLGLGVKKGQGPRSATVALLDPIPKLVCTEIEGSPIRICLPQIQLAILSTNLDPTDLDAKPLRTVHAYVLSEAPRL